MKHPRERIGRVLENTGNIILPAVFLLAVGRGTAVPEEASAPPIPPVESATHIGTVVQNQDILARDGNFSALIRGRSVWTFGDTPLAVPGEDGQYWADNTLSWTADLDAADGITLEHDVLDATGAPGEFLPYLPWERRYNDSHDAELAMWPGPLVFDPERNQVLIAYGEIWRRTGQPTWHSVGAGIAVAAPGEGITRPIQNPGSPTPTLMWGHDEVGFIASWMAEDSMLYAFGPVLDFLTMHYQLARVPLEDVLDKSAWRYYAGDGSWSSSPSDAVTVFDGGAAGSTVFFNAYLGMYMAVYSGIFSDDVYYRVSWTPWGPWSDEALLFTGQPGWQGSPDYAGQAHPEFARQGGKIQYVTYFHTTGFLRGDLPLVEVVFGPPDAPGGD